MMYRVPRGLAAMLGAGIFAGLAPAARVSGTWLLAGLVLAGLLAVGYGWRYAIEPGNQALSISDKPGLLGTLGRVAGASAIAGTFGLYVLPQHPLPAAIGVIVVTAALTLAGVRPSGTVVGILVALVLAVLVVFVAACLAIAPAGQVVAAPAGSPGTDRLAGLPAATALMFFGFLGFERAGGRTTRVVAIGVALAVYLAVGYAALRQLGGPRLASSPTPLRDALAAADASGIDAVLTVGAAVATVLALLGVFADLRRGTNRAVPPAAALLAAAGTVLLSVPASMAVAVGLTLAGYAVRLLRRDQHEDQRRNGQHDADHERCGADVAREEPAVVAPVPPDRPPDAGTQPDQDAEPAEPHVTEQHQHAGQERRQDRDRGDAEV